MGLATRTPFDRSPVWQSNRRTAEGARRHADPEFTLALEDESQDEPTANLDVRCYDEPTAGIAPPTASAAPGPGQAVRKSRGPATQDLPSQARIQPSAAPPAPSHAGKVARRDITTGTVLCDRYVLGRLLGAGGSSLIFQAVDRRCVGTNGSGNRIAIKLLRPDMRNNPHALTRLRREFRQMQRLSHPGIARVFELGCDADVWFMTMELVEGWTVNQWLQSAPDRNAVLRLIEACCEALHHAHEAGVVHGDLKPSNVLVLPGGAVKLVDFGSAADRDATMSVVDKERSFAATPQYASPQVLAGEAAEQRDDVFSLACLAYTVLTQGAHPFQHKSSTAAQQADLRPAYERGMSEREFDVISRALAWDREARPATAREFVAALLAADLDRRQPHIAGTPAAQPRGMATQPKPSIDSTSTKPIDAPAETAAPVAVANEHSVAPQIPESVPADPLARFKGYVAGPLAPPDARDARIAPNSTESKSAAEPAKQRRWPWRRTVLLGALLAAAAVIVASQIESQTEPAPHTAAELPAAPYAATESPVQQVAPEAISIESSAEPETQDPVVAPTPQRATVAPGEVSFTTRTLNVGANQTVAALALQRLKSTQGRARVSWTIEGGTAQQGVHYSIDQPQIVEFLDGQRIRTLFIPLRPDTDAASARLSKTFTVKLQQTAGGPSLGEIRQVYVTIVGDLMSAHNEATPVSGE
jgi:serine/threonine protein kinase